MPNTKAFRKGLIEKEKKKSHFDGPITSAPLSMRLTYALMHDDTHNWYNGEYIGNFSRIDKLAKDLVKEVNEWVKDGMPNKE